MPEKTVYLDWAATTPLGQEACEAMAPYLEPGMANLPSGGNANSLHSVGRSAFAALEDARVRMARALGARRPDEIVFTSGATEADDSAIFGIVSACRRIMRQRGEKDFVPHVVTTAFEHDAVLAPVARLESWGVEVTRLAPGRDGFVTADALQEAMRENTVLVSIMAANNEIGTIMPIAELAKVAHEGGALFHSDMVQLLGKAPIDLRALDVDAASFSAHKICGPKGVGALYLRAGTPFDAYLMGGGQEGGRRSGTQNVCGAVGFAAACEWACAHAEEETERLSRLRDRLCAELSGRKGVELTVPVADDGRHLPNIANVLVDGLESETLILRLDMDGVCVSGGSACSSHSLEPSHVLRAIGVDRDKALCSLRISMGRYTSEEDVDAFLAAFDKALAWD